MQKSFENTKASFVFLGLLTYIVLRLAYSISNLVIFIYNTLETHEGY